MSEQPEPRPPDGVAEAAEERQGTPFLVVQFFLFPLSIVAVCVLVFVVFGMIAAEGKGAREYLDEVKNGNANRRWQAAFELSKVLQAGKDPVLRDPTFAGQVVDLFRAAQQDDPRVRRYLALALGRLQDRRAVPSLVAAATPASAGGPGASPSPSFDAETQVYAIWALGAIADPSAVPVLLELARSSDPGVRKAAVHALGSFREAEPREAVASALSDPVADVRWNAALALGRHRDPRAVPLLEQMLDRGQLAAVPDVTPEQREEIVVSAAGVARQMDDAGLRARVAALAESDPNPRVREAARPPAPAR